MDIDLLSRMVRELILRQDCVGLPGIGTFYAEQAPASFSDRGYTINPPYRKLNFRQDHPEDKSLVLLYADSNKRDPEVAEAILMQYLIEMKEVLKDRKTIVFPGLGRLRATRENRFFFVADQDLDIFPDGFGLAPVSLRFHESIPLKPGTHDTTPAPIQKAPEQNPESTQSQEVPVLEPETAPIQETPEQNSESTQSQEVPAQEPETAPIQETPEQNPESTQSQEVPAQEPEAAPEPKSKHFHWWTIVVVILVLALIGLVAFAILGRVEPDLVDRFLYTPEELRIIHY